MAILEEHQREVESRVKSWEVQGLSFPCPLNACGTAPNSLLRACSSLWRSKLLPSVQLKRLRMAKEISPRKNITSFANSTATSSHPHRHGEEHQSVSSPHSPSIPVHRTKHRTKPHHPHPTRETSQKLLLLATTPISTETRLCGVSCASFRSSPLPTLTPTRVKCSIIDSYKNKLVLVCDLSFLAPQFLPALSLHLPRKHLQEWPIQGAQQCNSSPPNDSWVLLWLYLFSK